MRKKKLKLNKDTLTIVRICRIKVAAGSSQYAVELFFRELMRQKKEKQQGKRKRLYFRRKGTLKDMEVLNIDKEKETSS